MKIVTVSLSRTIPTGPYANVKIGMEGTLEGEESPFDALDKLKRLIDNWYIKEYPPQESNPEPSLTRFPPPLTGPAVIEIQTDKGPDDRIAAMIADIYSCTEIKVLEGYRLLAKTKPEFQAAYDQQMEKLTNRPV
jgi:hypothetical protein